MQENLRYQQRVVSGTSQAISQAAPLAPKTDRVVVVETIPSVNTPKSETDLKPAPRKEDNKPKPPVRQEHRPQGPGLENRRYEDRRKVQRPPEPKREKDSRKENPIWDVANKLSEEKIKKEVEKTPVIEILTKPNEVPKPEAITQDTKEKEDFKQGVIKPGDKVTF